MKPETWQIDEWIDNYVIDLKYGTIILILERLKKRHRKQIRKKEAKS